MWVPIRTTNWCDLWAPTLELCRKLFSQCLKQVRLRIGYFRAPLPLTSRCSNDGSIVCVSTPTKYRLIKPTLPYEIIPDILVSSLVQFWGVKCWFDANLEKDRKLNVVQSPFLQMRNSLWWSNLTNSKNKHLHSECYETPCMQEYQGIISQITQCCVAKHAAMLFASLVLCLPRFQLLNCFLPLTIHFPFHITELIFLSK